MTGHSYAIKSGGKKISRRKLPLTLGRPLPGISPEKHSLSFTTTAQGSRNKFMVFYFCQERKPQEDGGCRASLPNGDKDEPYPSESYY
ncbi:hypothetical protein CDAR_185271 [Caerostris darwini]|uniref:Uncharacterized protein n=1 Tax=Caerostris darwini TaxID=1538125 RepID=A0AAV4SMT6_9ARAC|nr:hypothetical protein CDAR_185271 [Caerostris darwini]